MDWGWGVLGVGQFTPSGISVLAFWKFMGTVLFFLFFSFLEGGKRGKEGMRFLPYTIGRYESFLYFPSTFLPLPFS